MFYTHTRKCIRTYSIDQKRKESEHIAHTYKDAHKHILSEQSISMATLTTQEGEDVTPADSPWKHCH